MTPDELKGRFADTNKSQAHQWRCGKIEAAHAVGQQVRLQALLPRGWSQRPPIFTLDRQQRLTTDHLKRLLQFLPDKGRTQDGVSVNDLLPRMLQCAQVERPFESATDLI